MLLSGMQLNCLRTLLMSMAFCRDTAGQERYASLAPLYYRGASAATVVYDITNAESFQKAKQWVSELQKNASGTIGELNTLY